MPNKEGACLLCQAPLLYLESAEVMRCSMCGREFSSYARCENGHFICDECHEKRGLELIMTYCMDSGSASPITMVMDMMDDPFIYMHGPEHHVMVGAALLTAYKNAGGELDLKAALSEMQSRGKNYPGGSCGYWGCCGAAVSVGMCFSIITGATPLGVKNWGLANRATAKALSAIGDIGGPRCCKRNSFTAIKAAAELFKSELHVTLDMPDRIVCRFSRYNHECKRLACPYYDKGAV